MSARAALRQTTDRVVFELWHCLRRLHGAGELTAFEADLWALVTMHPAIRRRTSPGDVLVSGNPDSGLSVWKEPA